MEESTQQQRLLVAMYFGACKTAFHVLLSTNPITAGRPVMQIPWTAPFTGVCSIPGSGRAYRLAYAQTGGFFQPNFCKTLKV